MCVCVCVIYCCALTYFAAATAVCVWPRGKRKHRKRLTKNENLFFSLLAVSLAHQPFVCLLIAIAVVSVCLTARTFFQFASLRSPLTPIPAAQWLRC